LEHYRVRQSDTLASWLPFLTNSNANGPARNHEPSDGGNAVLPGADGGMICLPIEVRPAIYFIFASLRLCDNPSPQA
jgi:hypothetical protein